MAKTMSAALAALDELERLRGVLLPEFEGKIGEPSLKVIARLREAVGPRKPKRDKTIPWSSHHNVPIH